MMEPHIQSYELTAASTLTSQQLEVYRLYQMCGVNMTNEKFKVILRMNPTNNKLTHRGGGPKKIIKISS